MKVKNISTKQIVTVDSAIVSIPPLPFEFTDDSVASAEWVEIWKYLNHYQIANTIDISIIIAYCNEISLLNKSNIELTLQKTYINDNGEERPSPWIAIKNTAIQNIIKIASEYGFTPLARSKMKLQTPKNKNKLSDLL